jgi:hypothetical protein
MEQLSRAEWRVLNSTADDAEDLERIYRCLAFEYVTSVGEPGDARTDLWREIRPPISLAEVAEAIRSLLARDLLTVRRDPAESPGADDPSNIWNAWFEMSEAGRSLWQSTEEP